MIAWGIGLTEAADVRFDALTGVRTAPDAALEQPFEWEPEFEPTALGAVLGSVSARGRGAWGRLDASAWGMVPEPDAVLASLGPRGGVFGDSGKVRWEAAARYDLQVYPFLNDATNGRAEGLLAARLPLDALEPSLTVEAIDRRYPFESAWSFRTLEPVAGLELRTKDRRRWLRLGAGGQVNDGGAGLGAQVRCSGELGASGRGWEVWAAYRWIAAFDGAADAAARSLFTPLGDYSADADALSAGGFVQHRLEVGSTVELGEWTARSSALGRVRDSQAAGETYDRTVHGQLDVQRELTEVLAARGTLGASGVRLVGGQSYLDLYAWVGLSWDLSPREAEPTEGR